MLVAITSMKIKPGKRDEFIKASLICAEATHKEKGAIQYDYTLKSDDPDGVLCVERWENLECAMAHLQTDHFKAMSKVSNELSAGFEVRLYDATPNHALDSHFPPASD